MWSEINVNLHPQSTEKIKTNDKQILGKIRVSRRRICRLVLCNRFLWNNNLLDFLTRWRLKTGVFNQGNRVPIERQNSKQKTILFLTPMQIHSKMKKQRVLHYEARSITANVPSICVRWRIEQTHLI